MARESIQVKSGPKALMAWLALAVILVWVAVNWPQGSEKTVLPASSITSDSTTETTTSTPGGSKSPAQAEVVAATLNFRSNPEYEDRTIIKTLALGTVMKVIERKDGWLHVELDTGQSGYVADKPDFVRMVE